MAGYELRAILDQIAAKEVASWGGPSLLSPGRGVECCYLLSDGTCVQFSLTMFTLDIDRVARIILGEKGQGYHSRTKWSRQTKTYPDSIVVSKTGLHKTVQVKSK